MTAPVADLIDVDPELLGEALRELAGPVGEGYVNRVPRSFVETVVALLSEDLGCDHSVGICMCGIVGIVQDLNLVLQGRKRCDDCDDGIGYDPVKAEADRKLYDPDYGYYAADTAGLIKCLTCDGRGTVPVA
jgi:hypothetical protein